jgi:hypothetical protein
VDLRKCRSRSGLREFKVSIERNKSSDGNPIPNTGAITQGTTTTAAFGNQGSATRNPKIILKDGKRKK